MKSAYNMEWLHNLTIIKEAKQWQKSDLISSEQLMAIQTEYPSSFFHPNMMIRILLFIAALIATMGIAGLFFLFFADGGQDAFSFAAIFYGIASLFFLEMVFIHKARHYKSGVTEAILYQSLAFIISGIIGFTDFNERVVILSFLVLFALSAIRYHDLISTMVAMGSFVYLVFFELYQMGGIMQQSIPIAMMVLFVPIYIYFKQLKKRNHLGLWLDCLIVAEAFSLVVIYAAGNYFVVRELSEVLLNLYIAPDEEIPLSWLFYILTVVIPILYLYFGIKKKDRVLLRISLISLAFSVFTFKYYYSTGHHEITFTVAGIILLITSISLMRYLKVIRNGYTRENILSDKWANSNAEAFIISQTLGGNKNMPAEAPKQGGGGTFGGGGASGDF